METYHNQLRTRILLQLTLALLAVVLLIPTIRGPLLQQARMLIATPIGLAWTLRQTGIREGLPDSDPADEQNALHAKTSASFNSLPILSFVERASSPANGQLIASSGSFQAIQRSCSGAQ